MSRLLISKKGVKPTILLVLGIFIIAISVFLFANGGTERHFGDSDFDATIKVLAPILSIVVGLLCTIMAVNYGKTSICVYDDHIEGVGMGKHSLSVHNFYFEKHMNYTVQQSSTLLRISCGSENYAVSLKAADSQEVYRCIYGGAASAAQAAPCSTPHQESAPKSNPQSQSAPARIIATCPHCGTKCRVPAGKGLIRITCPNASCKIPFTFDS